MSPEYYDSVLTRNKFTGKIIESEIYSFGMVLLHHFMNEIRSIENEPKDLNFAGFNKTSSDIEEQLSKFEKFHRGSP